MKQLTDENATQKKANNDKDKRVTELTQYVKSLCDDLDKLLLLEVGCQLMGKLVRSILPDGHRLRPSDAWDYTFTDLKLHADKEMYQAIMRDYPELKGTIKGWRQGAFSVAHPHDCDITADDIAAVIRRTYDPKANNLKFTNAMRALDCLKFLAAKLGNEPLFVSTKGGKETSGLSQPPN